MYRISLEVGGSVSSMFAILISPPRAVYVLSTTVVWEMLILGASIFLLASAINLCYSFEEQPELYSFVYKTLAVVQFLRVVNTTHRLGRLQSQIQHHFRLLVSQNKRRFVSKKSGLNLDLTYICDR